MSCLCSVSSLALKQSGRSSEYKNVAHLCSDRTFPSEITKATVKMHLHFVEMACIL